MGTGTPVNGNGSARAGTRALTLLATPISATALQALADGPRRLIDLRRECGAPAQTTLRAYLKELDGIGAIERRRGSAFPGAVECELTSVGHDLLFVADALERWLRQAPSGALTLGGSEAKAAVKALSDGWSTTIVRALAVRPLTLTELDSVITAVSYPSLERRLTAMRLAGLVEVHPSDSRGTPCGATDWLRQGVGPLIAASRWERHHARETTAPIGALDAETAFLLVVPTVRLSASVSGSCRMAVEIGKGARRALAGVTVEVRDGAVIACSTDLQGHPDAWALGPSAAWLEAVFAPTARHVTLGGDCGLARALVEGAVGACAQLESKSPLRV